ncbi:MAG: CYTH domain-containing protein [Turicibacter sp.]|nr:CYTH domain-containing protein [Turicibacter sp.]
MSTNLEIEFKNMLTETKYKELLARFNIKENQIWTQKNVYFDTPHEALKAHHAALRVRIKNNTYELTLKTKATVGLLETNQLITKAEYTQLIQYHQFVKGPVYDALIKLGISINDLYVTTDLTTKRAEIPYKSGLLVLDQSFYGNIIDFELEYEVSDYQKGQTIFNNFLTTYNIPLQPAESKIKRALAATKK